MQAQETRTTKKRSLLVKKPFLRMTSEGLGEHDTEITGSVGMENPYYDKIVQRRVTQEDFLRELDPLGHLVYNKNYYPDIWRQDSETGRWYVEEVPRYAFSFQHIILTKHLTHLCGNDIVFELADKRDDEQSREVLNAFKRGWAYKNMEVAWYELARSVKATGDGAIVGYLEKGEFGWRSLSFLNGDVLFPHYDRRTGKLKVFARAYENYDDDGETRKYVDVWDDKYYYCYQNISDSDEDAVALPASSVLNEYEMDDYVLIECSLHGFNKMPIAYHRCDEGACWSRSQEAIDNYEIAFSRLAQSNHNFGLPIMYVKGEGSEELSSADMSYASKVILLPSDGEAGFLNRQDASSAYKAELEMLETMIYRMSFAVKTPELKSGDLPAAALKMLYSDAYENAMSDTQQFQHAIDDMVEMFIHGYGLESEMRLQFKNTPIRSYVEVYVHRNVAAEIVDMSSAVQNGYLSKQTASEKSYYSSPQEWSRILQEKHDDEMQKLLIEDQRLEMQSEQQVETQEQLAEINADQQIRVAEAQNGESDSDDDDEDKTKKVTRKKGKIATGRGKGRPNTSGKIWDSNGNWEGRNNWNRWNATH